MVLLKRVSTEPARTPFKFLRDTRRRKYKETENEYKAVAGNIITLIHARLLPTTIHLRENMSL